MKEKKKYWFYLKSPHLLQTLKQSYFKIFSNSANLFLCPLCRAEGTKSVSSKPFIKYATPSSSLSLHVVFWSTGAHTYNELGVFVLFWGVTLKHWIRQLELNLIFLPYDISYWGKWPQLCCAIKHKQSSSSKETRLTCATSPAQTAPNLC